jgi:predicted MPP superfamily phosphohydrolase
MANELDPDISFVTGDFVSSEGDPLEACITELSRLRAPLGVWGCNGNHEIYAGVEAEAERLFGKMGMRLLRASSAVVEHNGGRFNLLGVDYQRDHMVSGENTRPSIHASARSSRWFVAICRTSFSRTIQTRFAAPPNWASN